MSSTKGRNGRAIVNAVIRACVLGVVASCVGNVEYLRFERLQGDARVWTREENNGYPKYWILFPEIPIAGSSTSDFTVSGLPQSAYMLGLALGPEGTPEALETIKANEVHADLEIIDSHGKTIRHAWGALEESVPGRLESSVPDYPLSFEGVQRLIFFPLQLGIGQEFCPSVRFKYTVRIRLTSKGEGPVELNGENLTLRPVLWAGGFKGGFFALE